METIVTVNNQQFRIESNVSLSQEQKNEVIRQLSKNGCSSCGNKSNISTLAACPGTKYVGESVRLTSTPSGGTSPYNIEFRRNGTAIPGGTFTGVTTATINYPLVDADSPSVTISVYITDSCPSGAKNNTDQCVIDVGSCNVPNCGFTVS